MTKILKNFQIIFFICFFLVNLSLQSETVWNCVEDYDSPSVCTNQDNQILIIDSTQDDFSLKQFGENFIAYIETPEFSGKLTVINNKYIASFTEQGYATAVIEVDEKLNFVGETVEYFFEDVPDNPYKYYKGEYIVDADGIVVAEGYGFAEIMTGGTYEGQFKANERHGKGSYSNETNDEKFVGEFWNDAAIEGIYYYNNGDTYTGTFLNGMKHGFGEYRYANGAKYIGGYNNDLMEGLGTLYYINGSRYEGEILEGKYHGKGIYYYPPESEYKLFSGTYRNGKEHNGTYIDSEGRPVDSGQLKDGLLHGEGTAYSYKEDGSIDYIYRGNFKNGLCHGICSLIHSGGSSFKGEFINGERKGIGELRFSYSILSGYFDINGIQGNGKYTDLLRAYEWEGPFINGKREGQGVVTFLDDGGRFSATFENDIYVGLEELTQENLTKNKRIALVIGNDKYMSNPLQFAVADSHGISDALGDAGFDVTHITNTTQEDFLEALYDFQRKILLSGKNTDVLFYYAGHASQVRGINYLNPVDTVINRESQLEIKSININRVFEVLNQSVDGVKIAILDACRNNPFASSLRSAKSGLAQMNAPPGTIIAYSTSPGETAVDGSNGGLGIYTGSLIGSIRKPGIKIEEVFKDTRKNVVNLTGGQQIPWESSSLISDFYFTREN